MYKSFFVNSIILINYTLVLLKDGKTTEIQTSKNKTVYDGQQSRINIKYSMTLTV